MVCTGNGHYEMLSEDDRVRKRKPTLTCGCKANYWINKLGDQFWYRCTYRWNHTGHSPSTVLQFQRQRPSRVLKAYVERAVDSGVSWKAFKLRHVPAADVIAQAEQHRAGVPQLPEFAHITHDVFSNAKRAVQEPEVRLDLDVVKTREQGRIFFHMDATHDPCYGIAGPDEKCFLTSLSIKDLVTGKGLPSAWMLSNLETATPTSTFLRWVQQQVPEFSPAQFMIDCSATEVKAISDVFPDAMIFDCWWHFLRAIQGNIRSKRVFQDIATNNFTEAWHARYKGPEFKTWRLQRMDNAVAALEKINRMFWWEHAQVLMGTLERTMDKAERSRFDKASKLTDAEACYAVVILPQGTFIRSFQTPDVGYLLQIDAEQRISGCACPDHENHLLPCKHMHTASCVLRHDISFGFDASVLSPPLPAAPAAKAKARAAEQDVKRERALREGLEHAQAVQQLYGSALI
ncbi:hypothetical protein JCM11641_005388 [Rhodosporidiobolus odoratus]